MLAIDRDIAGDYWDENIEQIWRDLPLLAKLDQRDKYINGVIMNPSAVQQLREWDATRD